MLYHSIVSALGGFWKLRVKIHGARIKFLRKMLQHVYNADMKEHGSFIPVNCRIESMPCFPHGYYGIFISQHSTIGKDCVIFHHVTIGSNSLPDSKGFGAPKIGDNCFIGAGAKIIGNVTIGNNVRIGANAVVHADIPDNSTVISGMQDIRIRSCAGLNRFYYMKGSRVLYFKDGGWVVDNDPGVEALFRKHFRGK